MQSKFTIFIWQKRNCILNAYRDIMGKGKKQNKACSLYSCWSISRSNGVCKWQLWSHIRVIRCHDVVGMNELKEIKLQSYGPEKVIVWPTVVNTAVIWQECGNYIIVLRQWWYFEFEDGLFFVEKVEFEDDMTSYYILRTVILHWWNIVFLIPKRKKMREKEIKVWWPLWGNY